MGDGAARRPRVLARLRAATAGIVLVVTVLAALTQKTIRDFGATPAPEATPAPAPEAAPAPAAGDSRRPAPGPRAVRMIMAI